VQVHHVRDVFRRDTRLGGRVANRELDFAVDVLGLVLLRFRQSLLVFGLGLADPLLEQLVEVARLAGLLLLQSRHVAAVLLDLLRGNPAERPLQLLVLRLELFLFVEDALLRRVERVVVHDRPLAFLGFHGGLALRVRDRVLRIEILEHQCSPQGLMVMPHDACASRANQWVATKDGGR